MSDLAQAAYLKLHGAGSKEQGVQAPSSKLQAPSSKQLEAFRVEQADIACGVRISGALQRHYLDLKAHFEAILGETGAAFGTLMRAETNGARQALYKIRAALKERGLDESYAAVIARAQFKKPLESCSEKQLWCLFSTITNRRKKTSHSKAPPLHHSTDIPY